MTFIISNLITLGNLFCGSLALYFTMQDRFVLATSMIFLAMIFDLLDGEIARLIRASSEFGAQIDSFADFVSFGVAPAVLVVAVFLKEEAKAPWFFSFIYITCGMVRLARYNIASKSQRNDYFSGLPIPAAAGFLTSFLLMYINLKKASFLNFMPLVMVSISLLMVSSIKYSGFRHKTLIKNIFFFSIFVLSIIAIFYHHSYFIIFLCFAAYALSGIFFELTQKTYLFGKKSKL